MLSSFCSAVLIGRIHPFETMKRDSAGAPETWASPQGADAKHHPATALGQGRWRDQSSQPEVQKVQNSMICNGAAAFIVRDADGALCALLFQTLQ